jgi:hypothetical protein
MECYIMLLRDETAVRRGRWIAPCSRAGKNLASSKPVATCGLCVGTVLCDQSPRGDAGQYEMKCLSGLMRRTNS